MITLSDKDLVTLREMAAEHRSRRRSTPNRPAVVPIDEPSAAMYLVKGPVAAGPNAFSEAAVYRTGEDGVPVSAGFSVTLCNQTALSVAAADFALVSQDAYGRWYLIPFKPLAVRKAGVLVGIEGALNFVSGATVVDNPTTGAVDVTVSGGGGGSLEVRAVSGSPDVVGVSVLQFNHDTGLAIVDDGSGSVTVSLLEAGIASLGGVSNVYQTFSGTKAFKNGVELRDVGFGGTTFTGGAGLNVDYVRILDSAYGSGYVSVGHPLNAAGTGILGTQGIMLAWEQGADNNYTGAMYMTKDALYLETRRGDNPGFMWSNVTITVKDSDGVFHAGTWATVSGLVFCGGLYTSGSLSVSPGTGSGLLVGQTAPVIVDPTVLQGVNGADTLVLVRATDVSPSGNFENFTTAAGASLWTVDVTGTLTAGTVPAARLSGLGGALSALGGITGSF